MAGGAGQLETSGAGAAFNETLILSLPAPIAGMLKREAKARKKTIAAIVTEWLEEQAEDRAAQKALAKAIKANKGKPSIKAEDLYAECGL